MGKEKLHFTAAICFGLLMDARPYDTGSSGGFGHASNVPSAPETMSALIEAITGTRCSATDTNVSKFRTCQSPGGDSIPLCKKSTADTYGEEINSSEKYPSAYKRMLQFVTNYVDPSEARQIVLLKNFLGLIKKDDCSDDTRFHVLPNGGVVEKRQLKEITTFDLVSFLMGVFYFVLCERRKHKEGEATFKTLFQKNGKEWAYVGDLANSIKTKISICESGNDDRSTVIGADDSEAESDNTNTVFVSAVNQSTFQLSLFEELKNSCSTPYQDKIHEYLDDAIKKYESVKTILFSDPCKLDDIYVASDLDYVRYSYTKNEFGISGAGARIKDDSFSVDKIDVLKLHEISDYTFITGTGGLGKSMMLRYLLIDTARKYNDLHVIPIFIPLKAFTENHSNLFELVVRSINSFSVTFSEDEILSFLRGGRCLLLFDALDEINGDAINDFDKEYESFVDNYSKNQFVITSRPFDSFSKYERFSELRLKPLGLNQAVELISKLNYEPNAKEKFIKELKNGLFYAHQDFAQIPLLLTIMLAIDDREGLIPKKLHNFYEMAFNVLATKHDGTKIGLQRKLATGLDIETISKLFAELCFRTYKRGIQDIPYESYKRLFIKIINNQKVYIDSKRGKIKQYLLTADNFKTDITKNICLMYFESNELHFIHRSFQEYFVARYFAGGNDENLYEITSIINTKIGETRYYSDYTFVMLHSMRQAQVEKFILVPYLEKLFSKYSTDDEDESYWKFIVDQFGTLQFSVDYVPCASPRNSANDYFYKFVAKMEGCETSYDYFGEGLINEDFAVETYVRITDYDDNDHMVENIVNLNELEVPNSDGEDFDVSGTVYEVDLAEILASHDRGKSKWTSEYLYITSLGFVLRDEYEKVKGYIRRINKSIEEKIPNLNDENDW